MISESKEMACTVKMGLQYALGYHSNFKVLIQPKQDKHERRGLNAFVVEL